MKSLKLYSNRCVETFNKYSIAWWLLVTRCRSILIHANKSSSLLNMRNWERRVDKYIQIMQIGTVEHHIDESNVDEFNSHCFSSIKSLPYVISSDCQPWERLCDLISENISTKIKQIKMKILHSKPFIPIFHMPLK